MTVFSTIAALSLWGASGAFDHSLFDALLRKHVAAGVVDYEAFAKAPEFPKYLDALARADLASLPEAERLALWIDAYNAYTIHLINLHKERESIRNIEKTLGVLKLKGPWQVPIAKVGGRTQTLDEIEHQIIRKQFKEPRIHFALVCAAVSCPPLRSEAYSGSKLEAQLDDQARLLLQRSPDKNRVDAKAGVVWLSPIFDWYKDDFGGTEAEAVRYVSRFLADGPEKRLLESGTFKIRYTEYDWRLNGPGPAPARTR